jgi:hypothetical protein
MPPGEAFPAASPLWAILLLSAPLRGVTTLSLHKAGFRFPATITRKR